MSSGVRWQRDWIEGEIGRRYRWWVEFAGRGGEGKTWDRNNAEWYSTSEKGGKVVVLGGHADLGEGVGGSFSKTWAAIECDADH